MDVLETLKAWLRTFPLWEGTIQVDYAQDLPGSTGLYPQGLRQLSRREDVAGNVHVRCRWEFRLRRSGVNLRENAAWLMAFQQWVLEQDALGLVPQFGDLPDVERLRATEGRLEQRGSLGSNLYTVLLQAEFTKIF